MEPNRTMTAHGQEVSRTRIPWRRLAIWFVASRILIWVNAGLSTLIIVPGRFFTPPASAIKWLSHWDAAWYMHVAQNGYTFAADRMSSVNFLPLYPLLVRVVG